MTIKEYPFSESLKSKGVTNLFLKDNEIIVELNDIIIKTKKHSLNLSISSQQQILKPTKCPTKTCKECKIRYIDRLGLEIFVICNCRCHRMDKTR